MRRILATLGLGLALAVTGLTTPPAGAQTAATAKPTQANRSPIEILTRVSVATGGYVEPTTGEWVVFRPYYPVDVRVVCPAGASAGLRFTPVFAMNLGARAFTCTGKPQRLTVGVGATNGVNELGWHRQTATVSLELYNAPATPDSPTTITPLGSDTEHVRVYTARSKAVYY